MKYHVLTLDKQIHFLGWFNNHQEALEKATGFPKGALLLSDSDLYRFIEQSKECLNHP